MGEERGRRVILRTGEDRSLTVAAPLEGSSLLEDERPALIVHADRVARAELAREQA